MTAGTFDVASFADTSAPEMCYPLKETTASYLGMGGEWEGLVVAVGEDLGWDGGRGTLIGWGGFVGGVKGEELQRTGCGLQKRGGLENLEVWGVAHCAGH